MFGDVVVVFYFVFDEEKCGVFGECFDELVVVIVCLVDLVVLLEMCEFVCYEVFFEFVVVWVDGVVVDCDVVLELYVFGESLCVVFDEVDDEFVGGDWIVEEFFEVV